MWRFGCDNAATATTATVIDTGCGSSSKTAEVDCIIPLTVNLSGVKTFEAKLDTALERKCRKCFIEVNMRSI